jgi:methylated-DNA-[protein]-cysteine S-methyltransferase
MNDTLGRPTDGPPPIEALLSRFAPPIRPPHLGGGDVNYVLEDTAVGRLLLAARSNGSLLACSYTPHEGVENHLLDRLAKVVSPRVVRGGHALDATRRQLAEFLAGQRHTFDLTVDLALATPFQRVVLSRLTGIVGYGRTTSYGSLAREIGQPTAARAVGTALGMNPVCVVVPCHRVVASSGALTGYAGGLEAKRQLLALETSHPLKLI